MQYLYSRLPQTFEEIERYTIAYATIGVRGNTNNRAPRKLPNESRMVTGFYKPVTIRPSTIPLFPHVLAAIASV